MSMTYDQMVTRSALYLQDTPNTRWSAATIGSFLNDAQRDFARGSKIIKNQANCAAYQTSLPNPAGAFYGLPPDLYELERVWNNAQHLTPVTTDALPWNWDSITGTPTRYLYGEFGLTDLRLYPYPTTASPGVTVYYTALPADIATGQTTPIPAQYHLALVYYAVGQCYLLDGQSQNAAKGQEFMQLYQRELADAVARSSRRQSSDNVSVPYRHL